MLLAAAPSGELREAAGPCASTLWSRDTSTARLGGKLRRVSAAPGLSPGKTISGASSTWSSLTGRSTSPRTVPKIRVRTVTGRLTLPSDSPPGEPTLTPVAVAVAGVVPACVSERGRVAGGRLEARPGDARARVRPEERVHGPVVAALPSGAVAPRRPHARRFGPGPGGDAGHEGDEGKPSEDGKGAMCDAPAALGWTVHRTGGSKSV